MCPFPGDLLVYLKMERNSISTLSVLSYNYEEQVASPYKPRKEIRWVSRYSYSVTKH